MSKRWLTGIDLGGTKTEVILLDENHQEHFRHRVPTPAGDYQATLATIQTLIERAEQYASQRGLPVGIGIPGTVSGVTGLIKNANSTWLNGKPMADDLRQLLGRPVALTNDANCLALSEATDGAGQNAGVVFAAILGTGCGAGISVDRRLLTGPNGVAGEWGHNPLPLTPQGELDDRPCFCGRRGCNETFLSGTGFSLTHQLSWGRRTSAQEIVAGAREGDRECRLTLDLYIEHLAKGLAAVINLLDPDMIVLGGGMSNVPELYQSLSGRLPQYVFGGECSTRVQPARHGDSSGVRGAAWLAAQETDPA